MAGVLKIHSTTAGTLRIGHSWIEYCPIDGQSMTYGTWGNNPTGEGNGLLENAEPPTLKANATRSQVIDHEQERRLFEIIETYRQRGDQAWTLRTPCSTFAAEAWGRATGEQLVHQTALVSTPARLAKSIIEANQRDAVAAHGKMSIPSNHTPADAGNGNSKSSKQTLPRKSRSRRR
ncbi:hypothetical protein [Rugamonas rivuli]|uniref:Uncharacterized protein n=1 Tax=Rugamonas rivuli TaxID=2743358 RepID=A0A843SN03_9BURK|nr:hypothetical protein [Rugamonas rivuli]MQA21666.1 hypothetical protein [Rugamonas rivuli]